MNSSAVPKATKKAQPVSTGSVAFEIGSGPPPPKSRNGKYDREYAAACALPPGGWMVWKSAPKGFRQSVRNWATASGLALSAYTDTDGRAIVIREAESEEPADESDDGRDEP